MLIYPQNPNKALDFVVIFFILWYNKHYYNGGIAVFEPLMRRAAKTKAIQKEDLSWI